MITIKKIYYISYYGDYSNNRGGAPSANTKIDYIAEKLKKYDYEVEILSMCEVNDKKGFFVKHDSYNKEINDIKIHFFGSYTSKFRILRVIGRLLSWNEKKKYIKKNCFKAGCKIIIYHSLLLFKIYTLFNKNKKKYILEVEEIYSDVKKKKNLRKKELKYLQKATQYIFPTQSLSNEINIDNKPYILVHGTYKIEENYGDLNFQGNKIHCVYAGTFDTRKGGAIAAIEATKYLSEKYYMHILGFGSEKEVENIKKLIIKISHETSATITYDGLLTGNDYTRFIQNCDIGLCTQNPNAAFNASSFPSKILSYMANGIRVVSIRIPVVEQSSIGDYVYYYNEQTPPTIAKAIMNVDVNDNYDGKKVIKKLDKNFEKEFKIFLDGSTK